MVTFVVFLNLFFVPAVALWIHKKRRREEIIPSLKLLMQYAIFASCNVPLTKVGILFIRKVVDWNISMDSGYYTVLAIIAAAMLPGLLDWVRAINANRDVLLKKGKIFLTRRTMKYRQKLLVMLLLVLQIVVAYMIRVPLEIYAKNAHQLLFTLADFMPWLLAIGVSVLVTFSGLLALLPDGPFHVASAILLWFGVASWLQDMFMNRILTGAQGNKLDWASLGTLPLNNFMIWMVLLAAVILLYVLRKNVCVSLTKLTAGALCLIQIIAIGFVLLTMPEKAPTQLALSDEKHLQLAYEENLIILLFDTAGTNDIDWMLQVYPEAGEIIKDFVYYNNACCDYYYTYPSVTHIWTGNEYIFQSNGLKWLRDSWKSDRCERFFQKLKDAGYERRFYMDPSVIGPKISAYGPFDEKLNKFDNIEPEQFQTNVSLLLEKMLRTAAFRCLPYLWKQPFEVMTLEFNDVTTVADHSVFSGKDNEFYQRLTTERLSVDVNLEKLISFTHFIGMHPPYVYDENLNIKEKSSAAESMRGIFMLLQEYFDQMKTLGVYDNSTIIIMSDHGNYGPGYAPIFFIKRPGETHEQTEINSAPVDYSEFQATILELLGENDGSFGTSFFDWQPGQKRRRILYLCPYEGDPTMPPVKGTQLNAHWGYVYYTDAEELWKHIYEDKPDYVEGGCDMVDDES